MDFSKPHPGEWNGFSVAENSETKCAACEGALTLFLLIYTMVASLYSTSYKTNAKRFRFAEIKKSLAKFRIC